MSATTFTRYDFPFASAIPELDCVGHSHVREALPIRQDVANSNTIALILVRRGGQAFRIQGRWVELKAGDLFVIPPHVGVSTGDRPTTRVEGYEVYLLLDEARPFLGNRAFEPLRESLRSLSAIQVKATRQVASAVGQIYNLVAQTKQDPLSAARVLVLLGGLLFDVLDAVQSRPTRRRRSYVDQAETFMRDRLDQMLSLQDLIDHTGYSRTALVDGFRRQRGVSPMDWFTQIKIERSAELLRQTDRPISLIAAELGFGSSQYFSNTFKRIMSVTPSAYRRSSRDNM